MHPLDLNCAILSEQIYSDTTPGPWFKLVQRNVSSNSFAPKANVFKRKSTVWIIFGGSTSAQDVVTNVNFATCSPFDDVNSCVKVHAGIWTNLKELMQMRIAPCLRSNITSCTDATNQVETVVLTGHSLGGAYATLARFFLAFAPNFDRSCFQRIKFHVVTFGAPLVFACESPQQSHALAELNYFCGNMRHYVCGCDVVPRLLGSKLRDWRPFVTRGFRGDKGLAAGMLSAGVVLLNFGTGGMAMSAAMLGSSFYAYYSANKFGGANQMAVAQLCAAPKLRDKWLKMLESKEARLYFPVGHFFLLEREVGAVEFGAGDMRSVQRLLDVPEGYDAYAKSIKHHNVEEYQSLLGLTLPGH